MIPIFASRNAIPRECLELMSCQCQGISNNVLQVQKKTRLQGTGACKCSDLQEDSPCINQLNAL